MVISCSYFGCTNRQVTSYKRKRKKKKIVQTRSTASETDTASETEGMDLDLEDNDSCRTNIVQSPIKITFHRFPKDPDRRKMWALTVNRKGPDGKLWQPTIFFPVTQAFT